MAISLESIKQGGEAKPPRVLLYGVEGVGKTTFASCAPSPIFIRTEDGLGDLDVPAFPLAQSFTDVMEALTALATGDHPYQTVVVDSVDWLESLVWKFTAETNNWKSIEDPGYGKGYIEADSAWLDYIAALNYLRDEKSMTVIQLAHNEVKAYNDPEREAYDRHVVKLHKRASALLRENCDYLLFANYRVGTTKDGQGFNEKTRAVGSGERILCTQEKPAYMAKRRTPMPDEIPMDWQAFAQHIRFYNQDTTEAA